MIKIYFLIIISCLSFTQMSLARKPFSKLVFRDEFSGKGLPNDTLWGYEEGYVRNGEMQFYTVKRQENCYQKDGYLHIVLLNDSALIDSKICPVTSASIISKGKKAWKYCKVEVRAKLPASLGTWPAIWMMPEKDNYGDWPKSGEIDIMEHVGYEPDNIHFAIHSNKYNHTKDNQKRHTVACPASYTDFHVYGLEWTKNEIKWFLDGKLQYSVTKDEKGWSAWPFDRPFYLILNSAFGGGWGGRNGVDITKLKQEYIIDYVRVYQ
jgi:beta-glucanase (GH16 family)